MILILSFIVIETAAICMIVLFFPVIRFAYYLSHGVRRLCLGRKKMLWQNMETNKKSIIPVIPGFLAESPGVFRHHNQWMIISSFIFRASRSDSDVELINEEGIRKALECCQIRHPFLRTVLLKPNQLLGQLAKKEMLIYGLSNLDKAPKIPVTINDVTCPAYEFSAVMSDIMTQESQSTKKVSGYDKLFIRLAIYQNVTSIKPNEHFVCFMFFMNHGLFDGKSLSTMMKDLLTFYTKQTDPQEYLIYCRINRKNDEDAEETKRKEKKNNFRKLLTLQTDKNQQQQQQQLAEAQKAAEEDAKKRGITLTTTTTDTSSSADSTSKGKDRANEETSTNDTLHSVKSEENLLPRLVEINEETIVLDVTKNYQENEEGSDIPISLENQSSSSTLPQKTSDEIESAIAKQKEIETLAALSDLPKLEKILPMSLDPIVIMEVKVSPLGLLKSGIAHLRFLVPFFGKLPIPLKTFKESALQTSRLFDTLYAKIRYRRYKEDKEAEEKMHPTILAPNLPNKRDSKRDSKQKLDFAINDEELLDANTLSATSNTNKTKSHGNSHIQSKSYTDTYKNDMSEIDYNAEMSEETMSMRLSNKHILCEGTRFLPFVLSAVETKFILGQVKQKQCTLHGLLTMAMLFAALELTNSMPDPEKEEEKKAAALATSEEASASTDASDKKPKKAKKNVPPKKKTIKMKKCEAPINTLVNARSYLGLSSDSIGDYIQMIKDPVTGLVLDDQTFLDDRANFWKLAVAYSNNVKNQVANKAIVTNSLFEAVFVPPSFRWLSIEQILKWTVQSLPSGRMNEFPISNLGVCSDLNKPFQSEELKVKFSPENFFFGVCEHLFGPILNNSIVTINGKLNWTVTSPHPLMKDDDIMKYHELCKKYLLWEMNQTTVVVLPQQQQQ